MTHCRGCGETEGRHKHWCPVKPVRMLRDKAAQPLPQPTFILSGGADEQVPQASQRPLSRLPFPARLTLEELLQTPDHGGCKQTVRRGEGEGEGEGE